MHHRRIAISLFILVIAPPVGWQTVKAEAVDDVEDRIARVRAGLRPAVAWKGQPTETWSLDDRRLHHQAPAVSVAVLDDFRVAWARAWGVVKTGSGEQATSETLFQFGSISKPVSTLLTLRMIGEGRLGLDEPVNRRLTSWRLPDSVAGGSEPVLLRHLLSHGGGIAPFVLPVYEPTEDYPGLLALLKNEADRPLPPVVRVRPPGARFEYANAGFAIVEQLLEDVSGEGFPQLAHDKLFAPLQMKSSSFARRLPAPLFERAAWGHSGKERSPIEGKGLYVPAAVGGLWSTPTDLCRLLRELMLAERGNDGRWFSAELAREMLSAQIQGQGLGVRLRGEGPERYFLHGGGLPGFAALFVAFPETGQGAVVATNGGAYALLGEILRAVAAEYAWPGYLAQFEIQEMAAARFARLEGRYVFDRSGGVETEIASRKGKYYRGRAEMVPVGPRTFVLPELGDIIEFLVESDGTTSTFRYGEPGVNQAWARRMPDDLPDRAHREAGVVRGAIRQILGPFSNLQTNLSEVDLEYLGIERGGHVEVKVGGQRFRARLVETISEARAGEWVLLSGGQPDRVLLGRHSANAKAELGVEPGAVIEFRAAVSDEQ